MKERQCETEKQLSCGCRDISQHVGKNLDQKMTSERVIVNEERNNLTFPILGLKIYEH